MRIGSENKIMPYRITITVTGIVTLQTVADEQRNTNFIDVISQALTEHYPEFKPDPKIPVVAVHVEEVSK